MEKLSNQWWDMAKGVAGRMNRVFDPGFAENQLRSKFYQTMNVFLTQTLTNLYNKVLTSPTPILSDGLRTEIKNSIQSIRPYLSDTIQQVGENPAHPVYFFAKLLSGVIAQYRDAPDKSQMAQQLKDLGDDMRQAEQHAARAQFEAAKRWQAQQRAKRTGRPVEPEVPKMPANRTHIQRLVTKYINDQQSLHALMRHFRLDQQTMQEFIRKARGRT